MGSVGIGAVIGQITTIRKGVARFVKLHNGCLVGGAQAGKDLHAGKIPQGLAVDFQGPQQKFANGPFPKR